MEAVAGVAKAEVAKAAVLRVAKAAVLRVELEAAEAATGSL